MARVLKDYVDRPNFDDTAGEHDRHALAVLGDNTEVVRDHERGHVPLLDKLAQQVEDLRLHRDVEPRGRLIGDQKARPR